MSHDGNFKYFVKWFVHVAIDFVEYRHNSRLVNPDCEFKSAKDLFIFSE